MTESLKKESLGSSVATLPHCSLLVTVQDLFYAFSQQEQ